MTEPFRFIDVSNMGEKNIEKGRSSSDVLFLCPKGGFMKRLLFKLRLFKHQFHPFYGLSSIHQFNENGAYECSYLIFTKSPFSSEVLLRIGYNRNEETFFRKAPHWL
jgi:hypothetical protein